MKAFVLYITSRKVRAQRLKFLQQKSESISGMKTMFFFTQVRGLASLPRVTAVAMFMSSEAQVKLKEVLKELDCLAGPGEREVWQKAFSV